MLGKMTSKNQITIPKKIIEKIPDAKHFDIEFNDGIITLNPVKFHEMTLEHIRSKMDQLGLKEDSVAEAMQWARSKK
ncbi:MAG: AbrB/MazE/SpoVT family DNA-binding domain-containing protein [Deltaproteobacteria bacterium]|nr:AbrB/MazE/SpoVT family DNA-binding domain-containing protein [Deltaproteobacteria bacterium]